MANLINYGVDKEKDEEKERLGPLKRREVQSEAVRKQLEEKMAELQLVLAHTVEAFQQLTNCAAKAYQAVTLGLVIVKAENDPLKPQTQRVNWNEVAQRIFATVTQLGVLQCSVEPKLNFLQTGNRMKSVYDVLTRLYLAPSETLQGNFPCSSNSRKESIEPSRPETGTKMTPYDDDIEKLIKQEKYATGEKIIKQEKYAAEEKMVKQEVCPPENEMNIMRSWAESATEKNEERSKMKSTVEIVPKIKKRCGFCRRKGHSAKQCLKKRMWKGWMKNNQTPPGPKREVTKRINDHRMEKPNTKDMNDQPNEGYMTIIQRMRGRKSVRRILETFSVPREDIWQKPLEEATEKEATAMILRWILDNLPAERSILMRSRNDDGDVFELRIRNHRGSLYARNVLQLKNAKRLYLWRTRITCNDLTIKEIEGSVRRAEEKDRSEQRRKEKCEETIPNEVNELST